MGDYGKKRGKNEIIIAICKTKMATIESIIAIIETKMSIMISKFQIMNS
jgi:hypothetical protein